MSTAPTFGREPTIGEVEAYYRRADVLEFLYEACCLRTVNASFRGGSQKGRFRVLEPRSPGQLRVILEEMFRD